MQNETMTPAEAQTEPETPAARSARSAPRGARVAAHPAAGQGRPSRRTRTRIKSALWAPGCRGAGPHAGPGSSAKPVAVETGLVRRGTLIVSVNEDGRTRVRDRYLISAPLAGTLTRLKAQGG